MEKYFGTKERLDYNAYIDHVPKCHRALCIILQPKKWITAYSFNKVCQYLIMRNHKDMNTMLRISDMLWKDLYLG